MTDRFVIQTDRLTRYFGRRAVVRELNFAVPRGSVVGLLGLNGAGKTTTIRMLLGFLSPTRGHCTVLGKDSAVLSPEDRSRIGHTVEGHFLYPWMRVRECERFGRETHPHWNGAFFEQAVRRFGIDTGAKVSWLSRGQRAGVSLASTLAGEPELLILDDPALGLDPVSRRALNETIIEFCDSGDRSVLLSSHLLDDIERVADRVAIMVDGRLLVDSKLDAFRNRMSGCLVRTDQDPTLSHPIPGMVHSRPVGDRWHLTFADADQETAAAVERIGALQVEPDEVTFEDAVLAYLSRSRMGHSFYSGAAS
ncbi:ABC transporter ATP-binding protein [Novipirellula artificiosorum]|uniref:Putative ABC transporter ATP-binding protein YbhF n=1 Tax=Novipirellula artificiosorum TaxID=2528016 RepID=A0A5C6D453_9BACT|nr:ABC transporter ATP-binding protein [Novipirellula artificiosorum]TWU32003.1 putative ABC transporter ATP-binding protein YbhF [Novipirellula artificiosorum]